MLPHEMFKYKKYYHCGEINKQWNSYKSQQWNQHRQWKTL